jgi:hypothetical protein
LVSRLHRAPRDSQTFWMPLKETRKKTRRLCFGRVIWTFLQEVFVGTLLTIITVLSLNWAVIPLLKATGKLLIGFTARFWPSISKIGAWLNSHLPHPNFFLEILYLWVAAIIVVAIASVFHRCRSTRERDELGARILRQKGLPEKHFR